jgi:hypothetical protein
MKVLRMPFVDSFFSGAYFAFANRKFRLVAVAVLLSFLICMPGCNKSGGKIPVHGHVTYRGEAIERASLTFFPETGRPEGTTVENGEYTIQLMPGDYTVTVLISVALPKGYKEGDTLPPPKIILPEEYISRARSTLKATVKAGQSEPIDFVLK